MAAAGANAIDLASCQLFAGYRDLNPVTMSRMMKGVNEPISE